MNRPHHDVRRIGRLRECDRVAVERAVPAAAAPLIATATRLALLGGYLEHPRHGDLRIHIAAGRQHPVPPQLGEDVGRIVRHHKHTLRELLPDVVGDLGEGLGLGETDAAGNAAQLRGRAEKRHAAHGAHEVVRGVP